MEGGGKYLKFFRVRSACNVERGLKFCLWLFESLWYIDFFEEYLIKEAIYVSQTTHGAFDYRSLRNMDFKSYELILEECLRINKKQEPEEE
jgi:hypothetical protein